MEKTASILLNHPSIRKRPEFLRMRSLPLIGFSALSLLWGSEWILAASLPAQPIFTSLAIRYAIAACILAPWAVRDRLWHVRPRSLLRTVLPGIGILCLPQILIVLASRGLQPSLSLVVLAGVPVVLAIVGRGTITTAVCGVAGVLFLTGNGLSMTLREVPWLLLPVAGMLVLAWSLLRSESGRPAEMTAAGSLFVQFGVAALIFAAASRLDGHQEIAWSTGSVSGFVIAAVAIAAFGYLLFFWLLAKLGSSRLGMLQWAQVLVATMEAAAFMRIRPGWDSILGAILIMVALVMAFSDRDDKPGVMLQVTQA